MKVLVVAGARPNFMKVAPLLAALDVAGHDRVFVHTGQHYDAAMSDAFFRDLGLSEPDFHLGVGSGSHAQQTARVMEAFEPVVLETLPDWVVVVGDVNSTLACALVASKLRHEHGCRIAHVEAGLRSDDWAMPEEVNRVLTDRLSDLLLIPSHDARAHLLQEGIDARRIMFVGNVMIDSLLRVLPQAKALDVPGRLGLKKGAYVVATIHRPSNVDEAAPLQVILESLGDITASMPVVLPMHPRTRDRVRSFNLDASLRGIRLMEPMGYTEMLGLQSEAALVLTDSGGMQEESTVLGIPCVTLRETTERPVTVSHGTNRMAPWPLAREGIRSSVKAALDSGRVPVGARSPEGWDGQAAERIIDALVRADSELRDGRARGIVSSVSDPH